MIITQITSYDNEDYNSFLSIQIDGENAIKFRDWETEDANLSRDFNSAYDIYWVLQKVYQAWKDWLEVDFNQIEVEWEDTF